MADDTHMGMPRDKWAETDVHKASTYACGKCGAHFADPEEFYEHLDREHPPNVTDKRKR